MQASSTGAKVRSALPRTIPGDRLSLRSGRRLRRLPDLVSKREQRAEAIGVFRVTVEASLDGVSLLKGEEALIQDSA
jgi:hypothetical protein